MAEMRPIDPAKVLAPVPALVLYGLFQQMRTMVSLQTIAYSELHKGNIAGFHEAIGKITAMQDKLAEQLDNLIRLPAPQGEPGGA